MNLLIPLFSPATGTWGGLTRGIAVAEAARQRGHQVSFCASNSFSIILKQHGFDVYPVPPATMFGLPTRISRIIERRSQRTAIPMKPGREFGNIWLVLFLSGMSRTAYLRRLVEAQLHAARKTEADFIFTDLDPGAYFLAHISGLPIATAYQTPMSQGIGSFAWKINNRAIRELLEERHCSVQSVETLFFGRQVLKIIPSIPELEDIDVARRDVCYVGHLLGDIHTKGRFDTEAGKRYVFTYLGTGAASEGKTRKVLPQVFPLNGRQKCLVAVQNLTSVEHLGGVEFHPYLPVADILPFCDWTIAHGGQNTIIQSLMNGVPLMIFPGPIFERRYNARKIQAAGAGIMGELNEFTPDWIQDALDHQVGCAERASELGKKIRALRGGIAAVEAMEQWCNRQS